jgi:hypothetical protein
MSAHPVRQLIIAIVAMVVRRPDHPVVAPSGARRAIRIFCLLLTPSILLGSGLSVEIEFAPKPRQKVKFIRKKRGRGTEITHLFARWTLAPMREQRIWRTPLGASGPIDGVANMARYLARPMLSLRADQRNPPPEIELPAG